MRNMVTSILENGEVTCTLARAKEVRAPLEKMITFAKRGDLHARRQVLRFVKSKLAMENLFGEIAERYKGRPSSSSTTPRTWPSTKAERGCFAKKTSSTTPQSGCHC